MSKIKLVVSDFHIGKGRFLKDGTKNILEDFHYDARFVEFLQHYSSAQFENKEVELIINGDFLNLLQAEYFGVHSYFITEEMTVHSVRAIIAGHPEVFDALRAFCEKPNHEIAYVIGNHDAGLYWDRARKVLMDCIGPKLRFYGLNYEFEGIRIEHGHQYESVNFLDPQSFSVQDPRYPEPVLNLPWASLFVAGFLPRIKKERPYVDKVKPFTGYLRWAVLHDLSFALRMGYYIVKAYLRMFFLARKHPLLDFGLNWKRLKGITIYPNFVREAKKLFSRRNNLHTIIFGHTHVTHYKQWGGGREYFNIGTWNEFTGLSIGELGLQVYLTYAYIEVPDSGQKARTRLKEWKGKWNPSVDAVSMPHI